MRRIKSWMGWSGLFAVLVIPPQALGAAKPVPPPDGAMPSFKKVMIVVLENTDRGDAMKQPFLSRIAREGALLKNMTAEGRPSQPNYIAMTSGSLHGVNTNDNYDLDVRHIADLLEAKGRTWKVYAEDYPGNCFRGRSSGKYVRKHNPFISYVNVQNDPARCARIVNASELQVDVAQDSLADYSFYIPDMDNSGHDKGIEHADRYLSAKFGNLLSDSRFMQDMLLVITFDESGLLGFNRIYTALYGPAVVPGSSSDRDYNHYSLMRTIEDAWGLGTLGLEDEAAQRISGIWK